MPLSNSRAARLAPHWLWCAAVLGGAGPARAQEVFAPPSAPAVLSAVRVARAPVVDGRLDDAAWSEAPVARGFRQADPHQGEAASLDTEVRVAFDDDFLYVGARLLDTLGHAGVRVPDLRREWDFAQNDLFGVVLDGFGGTGSSTTFQVNPLGAQRDAQVFDGSTTDQEWDAPWRARTVVSDSGWTAELAIPWSTLRYPPRGAEWRINFFRRLRRSNEFSGWSPWPRSFTPYDMRYAGRLTGLEAPPPSRNLRVQPYATSRLQGGGAMDAGSVQAGADLKWAPAPNSVLDLTLNPDFGQAEVDRQVVNLSRFSVFFPERRQFFLENASLFRVGFGSLGEPFFSRRVGLDEQGNPLSISAGARFTTRTARGSGGGLLVRQDAAHEQGGATVGVLRVQRGLGEDNRIGFMAVARSDDATDTTRAGMNVVGAVDAYLRPTRASYVRALASASATRGGGGEGASAFVHAAYDPNWGYVGWIQGFISGGYRADAGFVPRPDLIVTSPAASLDWRPGWLPSAIRALRPGFTTYAYHGASDGRLQEAYVRIRPMVATLQNGAEAAVFVEPNWQSPVVAFRPIPGLEALPGEYRYTRLGTVLRSDESRRLAAAVEASTGGYYDGDLRSLDVSLRASPSARAGLALRYLRNEIRHFGSTGASRVTHLVAPELRLAASPRMQLAALYQRNTAAGSGAWNARFAWEFRPLSHLYVVYNDRAPLAQGDGAFIRERQLIAKISWLSQL